jgi:hypothetical protein
MKSIRIAALTLVGTLFLTLIPSANADTYQKNTVVTYNKTASTFPKSVKNYKLSGTAPANSKRIFEGDDWVVPIPGFDPEQGNGATMSCQPYFWVIRWRSANPDVTIQVSKGITDGGQFDAVTKAINGGAGYVSDYSCLAPAFKFGKSIKNTGANLVDVNFEYQIWEYKPKI